MTSVNVSSSSNQVTGDKSNPILLEEDDDDEEEEEEEVKDNNTIQVRDSDKTKQDQVAILVEKQDCPYLNTIDRKALDFDFEKLCSVSLSKVNVYACLVCGKYFQGRGKSTHAFTHSVSEFHHVFLNIETQKFYCLPDNYEIVDPSLGDILHVLRPIFSQEEINTLDRIDQPVAAYNGKLYYPGIVGLNNLKHNDYCNVIFQALSHVVPLRNHFLAQTSCSPADSSYVKHHQTSSNSIEDHRYILTHRFGELLRKLWNGRNFKSHVSPHEMLQAIVLASKKRFEFTKQSDPIVFFGWFLNSLLGPKRERDSIIKRTFQGKIRIASRLLLPNVSCSAATDEPELIPADEEKFDTTSFQYLTLDLPAMPLFPKKDEKGRVIKPRVSIYELLAKFDGKTQHEFLAYKESSIKRYEILRLPKYLILYYKRFTKNTFFTEKNTHLVDFPINKLNLTKFVVGGGGGGDEPETIEADTSSVSFNKKQYNYMLVANIVHDGEPDSGKGTYRAHILHRGTGKWFEMQDLCVTEMADTMLITLSESYIQIWEREG